MLSYYNLAKSRNDNNAGLDNTFGDDVRLDSDAFNRFEEEKGKVQAHVYDWMMQNSYITEKVMEAIETKRDYLEIDIGEFDKLDRVWPDGSKLILSQPAIYLPALNGAVKELFNSRLDGADSDDRKIFRDPRFALKGWLRGNTITPRGLRASRLNTLVAVEGIVTRCGTAKHRVVESIYLAEKSEKRVVISYEQEHFYQPQMTSIVPIQDDNGNRFLMESGLTTFLDHQVFSIQEMPENAPSGQLPCSVEVAVSGGLVDRVKAGDRVSVWGVYKAKIWKENNRLHGGAKCWIDANNIEHLGGNAIKMNIEHDDLKLIRRISKMADPLDHVARSIVPNLFGGLDKKKGLLLQLVGGVPIELENNTMRIRGDINILLLGDPSCGKSQMLRFMMNVAPLAISTTGRGSSGVGLTAAARVDEENKGERVLEAGAMVMGDGGLVCIDEFDKMTQDDRTAIHEVMEQQTVSISKASIQTTLNARCSVLAAANPAYGCFDDARDIRSQICFPDSLLSRFDLIYLVHEANTVSEDRMICRTVLSNHIQKKSDDALSVLDAKTAKGGIGSDFSGVVNRTDWTVLPRDDPNATVQNYDGRTTEGNIIYSIHFLKKYIQHCKTYLPELSEDAVEAIANYYTLLRKKCAKSSGSGRGRFSVPTARSLEATIRLATAHAKLCLKKIVDVSDVRKAKELLHLTLLGEEYESDDEPLAIEVGAVKKVDVGRKDRKRSALDPKEVNKAQIVAEKMGLTVKRQKTKDGIEQTSTQTTGSKRKGSSTAKSVVEPSEEETNAFLRTIARLKDEDGGDEVPVDEFMAKVCKECDIAAISNDVFDKLIERGVSDNRIVLIEGIIWII